MKTRILVTGAAGFFGGHFVAHLLENTDWEIVGLVRTSKVGWLKRLFDQENYDASRVKLVHHDFRWALPSYVIAYMGRVDYICHAGAETHVDRSIENPDDFVMSNVLGTLNMLNYARSIKDELRLFHYFSTDEVYGPAPVGVLHTETERYNPTNPYAASKTGAEALVNAFASTYQLPVLTTSTMNLFGERQHPEKWIPRVMRAVINGDTVQVHSDATKQRAGSRFWIHCRNASDAVLFLLQLEKPPSRCNIVGEREVDNLAIAQLVAEIVGQPLRYEMVDFHSSRPGHDLRYALDGRFLHDLGYRFPVSFERSIEKTVQWTLKNPSWLIP